MNALALPAFQALAIFSVLLVAKMAAIAFYTAITRNSVKVTLNNEDAGTFKFSVDVAEAPAVARARRAQVGLMVQIILMVR